MGAPKTFKWDRIGFDPWPFLSGDQLQRRLRRLCQRPALEGGATDAVADSRQRLAAQ